jgi:phage terminase large subunit
MISNEQRKALESFQKNPALFFDKILGIETLESYQRAVLETIATNDRTAISACHDVGKSWTLARVILWYVTCFPYCKVITTAPTYNQVKNILWSEIRAGYARSKYPLGGKMNLTEWQVTKEGDWFAIGFTPRNELSGESGQGTQSSFQGFHAPYILVVFDEATGIPHNIWTMTEGILTSAHVKFVAIGNPTSRMAEFFKCFSSPAWAKVKLSCFNSPNLIENGITDKESLFAEVDRVRAMSDADAQAHMKAYRVVKPYLLSLKWVMSAALKWSVTHPLFVSKVLGEFPEDSDGTLIPLSIVEDARLRISYPASTDRKTLGLDVARFGSDSTVLTALHGLKFVARKEYVKKSTTEVTGEVIAWLRENGAVDVICIDVTGVGGGVVDNLNDAKNDSTHPAFELLRNTEIRAVQFGGAIECDGGESCTHTDCEKAKYVNLKARMFGLLRDDLKATNGLTLSEDDVYLDELPTILYRFDSKGRMFIESKDDYKKRTGRKSPDNADSLALANFGRYDEMSIGSFGDEFSSGFAKPFAASLGGKRTW